MLGDPGNSGGWKLGADGGAQGLLQAAARVGGLLCWVFSRAEAAHNGGPRMSAFFAFFFYTCSSTCSSEGCQPLLFLPAGSTRLFCFPGLWASSRSPSHRPPGVTLQGSLAGHIPILLPPAYPPQHGWLPGLCLCSTCPRGPFLSISI